MKKFIKTLGKIIAGILILALLLVIALAVIPLTEKVPTAPASDAGDWMAALPDDRVISEITMPGTHDCASMNAQLGFIKVSGTGYRAAAEYRRAVSGYPARRGGRDAEAVSRLHEMQGLSPAVGGADRFGGRAARLLCVS